MFFKKKNQNESGIMIMTINGPVPLNAGAALHSTAKCATSDVHEEIERQVKKRLSNKKFEEEFASVPEYRITERYDVKTHKDTYFLERKQRGFLNGWHSAPSDKPDYEIVWERVYASETKSEVVARFNRVMPKKTARKKAA